MEPERQARGLSCDRQAYCKELLTCEAAVFYFRQCGLTRLDGDNDGIPCEPLCR